MKHKTPASMENVTQVELPVEDKIVNMSGLANLSGLSRWTIHRIKIDGYEFQYGRYTTLRHFRQWMQDNKKTLTLTRRPPTPEQDERLNAKLESLN